MAIHDPVSMSEARSQTLRAFAEIARALGHEHRLELLNLVSQGERPVERLAELTGLSVANTSQHLQHLRRVGLVNTRRHGKYVMYQLSDPSVLDLITATQRVGMRTADPIKLLASNYFDQRDDRESVQSEELIGLMELGEALVLDARPADEYALGHIPGAINVPFAELESRLHEVPSDREIVAYCRGPYCAATFETVALLRAHGFEVRRLQGSFPVWKSSGHPVESGPPPFDDSAPAE